MASLKERLSKKYSAPGTQTPLRRLMREKRLNQASVDPLSEAREAAKREVERYMEGFKIEILAELVKRIDTRGFVDMVTPKKGKDYFDGEPGKPGTDGVDADEEKIVERVLALLPPPKEISPEQLREAAAFEVSKILLGKKSPSEEDIRQIAEKVQKTFSPSEHAKDIARALETLQGRERLDYHALKNLPVIPKGEKEGRTLHRGGGGGLNTYTYDLSASTDGSTRSFTVPTHTRAILLICSDFPTAYRPTTDFTTSGVTLTINAAVPAPSSGATLLFLYAV